MSLGVTYAIFHAGESWLLAALKPDLLLVHPRSGCGSSSPVTWPSAGRAALVAANPSRLPFAHSPLGEDHTFLERSLQPARCGLEVSGGRGSKTRHASAPKIVYTALVQVMWGFFCFVSPVDESIA